MIIMETGNAMLSAAETALTKLNVLESDVALIKSNYVTKEDIQWLDANFQKAITDVQKAINAQTWKLLGLSTTLVSATYFIAKHI